MTTLKQVFIVNSDLKMRKGKIAAQVAHGEVEYMQHIRDMKDIAIWGPTSDGVGNRVPATKSYIRFKRWYYDNGNTMKKVVLRAPLLEIGVIKCMLEDGGIWHHVVHDKGLTQVAPDSLTCVVVEPLLEDVCDKLFGKLKLL